MGSNETHAGRESGMATSADAGMGNASPWWTLQRTDDPVIATAIHDGSGLRPEVSRLMVLDPAQRLREEDPFTGQAILDVPTHIVVGRSRFEIDLNRAEPEAVCLAPEQSWGLQVWRVAPDPELVQRSCRMHRAFYATLGEVLDDVTATYGRFVLLDVHSYNHRRDGPDGAPMPQAVAPDINIGTHSMPRERWTALLDPLIEAMRDFDFNGRRLDVRENIAFQGKGKLARFVPQRYPQSATRDWRDFAWCWAGKPIPTAWWCRERATPCAFPQPHSRPSSIRGRRWSRLPASATTSSGVSLRARRRPLRLAEAIAFAASRVSAR